MKVRRTGAFRERKRFELRQQVRSSRTLRRYGYCEGDLWTAEEARVAESLLRGLRTTAQEQRSRMRLCSADGDAWLWGDGEPDYVSELGEVVKQLAGSDELVIALYTKVAERLLDRVRVRSATKEELDIAACLMSGVDVLGEGGQLQTHLLREKASVLDSGVSSAADMHASVARKVAERFARVGAWDGRVEDDVPIDIQPLHMAAVREALGALIPARLHSSLDKAAARAKDNFGVLKGGSVVVMSGWRLSVRAEGALAAGRLQEYALEFLLLVPKQICRVLNLPGPLGGR